MGWQAVPLASEGRPQRGRDGGAKGEVARLQASTVVGGQLKEQQQQERKMPNANPQLDGGKTERGRFAFTQLDEKGMEGQLWEPGLPTERTVHRGAEPASWKGELVRQWSTDREHDKATQKLKEIQRHKGGHTQWARWVEMHSEWGN